MTSSACVSVYVVARLNLRLNKIEINCFEKV